MEVNSVSTYYDIRNSGMIPKALLPGNNFLFASHNEPSLSGYYLNNTLSLISTYSNRWLEYQTKDKYTPIIIDKREIVHRNRYGISIAICRSYDKGWLEILKNEPIFAVCG